MPCHLEDGRGDTTPNRLAFLALGLAFLALGLGSEDL